MREAILSHLSTAQYRPSRLKELARDLGVPTPGYRAFRQVVRELEEAGEVARVGRNRYVRAGADGRAVGTLRLNPRGFGFVARTGSEADVLVQARNLGGAADGDWVEVEVLTGGTRGRLPEGRVTTIRQRPAARLVVTASAPDGGAAAGHIAETFVVPGDPSTDLQVVVARHGLRVPFPHAALVEAEACEDDVETSLGDRLDLRGLEALTIDPVEARDFDDAVSIEFADSGHIHLGVHIADVAHYVGPGSAMDLEARERGTSVYLVDQVLPMLPERLSGELCTLAPGRDRLTLSVLATIDGAGRLVESRVCESVIRSRARLTYEQVQAAIDGEEGAGRAAAWRDSLIAMQALSQRLRARRHDRGALDFELPEPRVVLDEEGNPVRLGRRPTLRSHQLVEEFMLVANEAVAAFAESRSLAVLYRIHRPPDATKLSTFAAYAATMGAQVKVGGGSGPTSSTLQEVLRRFAGRPDADLVSQLLLRAMMRAEYSPEPHAHFGLASPHYLHFTSPIRRYPDLQVHRQIKSALRERADREVQPDRPGQSSGPDHPGVDLQWLGRWTTECEKRADAAERTHIRCKQLRFMRRHVGEEFDGRVTGLLRGGIFAEVGDLMVEGFCPLSSLDDYYELDEQSHCLVGRSGDRFRIGTALRLQIARVDLALLRLDLAILSRGETGGRHPQRRKRRSMRSRRRRRR